MIFSCTVVHWCDHSQRVKIASSRRTTNVNHQSSLWWHRCRSYLTSPHLTWLHLKWPRVVCNEWPRSDPVRRGFDQSERSRSYCASYLLDGDLYI